MISLFQSCRDEYLHPVPDVDVNFSISINSYFELQNINGYTYIDNYGYNGIVVFRYSQDEFTAFDRACPHDVYEHECKIEVIDPPIAEDPCCNSQFLLIDGSVVDGPSKHPLKQYNASFNPETNRVTITNW